MEIVNRVSRMSSICAKVTAGDMKVGLVSTIGAIHPGHLSLIQTARKMTDVVEVSIFVNRLQYLTEEEDQKYPRDITKDVDLLRHENAAVVEGIQLRVEGDWEALVDRCGDEARASSGVAA